MIEEMAKVELIGVRTEASAFIYELQKLKILHVIEKDVAEDEFQRDKDLLSLKVILENLETRLSVILSNLVLDSFPIPRLDEIEFRSNEEIIISANKLLEIIEPQVQAVEAERRDISSQKEKLTRYNQIISRVKPLLYEIRKKEDFESIVIMLDRQFDAELKRLEAKIKIITGDVYDIFSRIVDENYIAVLVLFYKEYLNEIQSFVTSQNIGELHLPTELRNVKLEEFDSKLSKIQDEQISREQYLEHYRSDLINQHIIELVNLRHEVNYHLETFNLKEKMAWTIETFEIEGYIPESRWKEFKSKIYDKFGNKILILKSEADENAPVLRKNPRLVKPFETITNMIQLPVYGSVDPTLLIFILFPFFWGFMVGDMGYALSIMIIAFLLRKKFIKQQNQSLQNLSEMFIISSIWAFGFGIIYGEIFGDLGEHLLHIHPLFDRYHYVQELLLITVALGYIIIMGGMGLGYYNNKKINRSHEANSTLLLLFIWIATGIIVLSFLILPDIVIIMVAIFLLIILIITGILIKMEGIAGIIHIIEKFSNILSFMRLMAIGLVGAWMGFVANFIGLEFYPIGIIFAIPLHLINLIILILSPSIHAMRLNVYEIFTQFVVEGGTKYRPFGQY